MQKIFCSLTGDMPSILFVICQTAVILSAVDRLVALCYRTLFCSCQIVLHLTALLFCVRWQGKDSNLYSSPPTLLPSTPCHIIAGFSPARIPRTAQQRMRRGSSIKRKEVLCLQACIHSRLKLSKIVCNVFAPFVCVFSAALVRLQTLQAGLFVCVNVN